MYPYRVFISYSHEDTELMKKLKNYLFEIGARPMSDLDIAGGARFSEEIRRQVSYAHIFISLLTRNSKDRPWIHQEIGYAMGLRVPILPLALDELPEGMAQEIQAVKVDPQLADLHLKLTPSILDDLIFSAQRSAMAMYECADMLYERTKILVDGATTIHRLYGPQRLRQRMAFSSFSLPNRNIKHADWDEREGAERRSPEVRELLLGERRILEMHAREAGCDLIIDPYVRSSSTMSKDQDTAGLLSPTAKRLKILVEFLESMPDDKIRVIFQEGKIDGGVHIIGDWFSAEAVVPHYKGGYRQTIFTRHAPSVLTKVKAFDEEFEDMLLDVKLEAMSTREAAIVMLKDIIGTITHK